MNESKKLRKERLKDEEILGKMKAWLEHSKRQKSKEAEYIKELNKKNHDEDEDGEGMDVNKQNANRKDAH